MHVQAMVDEDKVMDGLRKFDIAPGDYLIPCAGSPKEMSTPEFIDKMTRGPVAFLTVTKSGPPSMGMSLILWFIYCVVVGVFAAYITGRALSAGVHYLAVFRFAGCTAFIGYTLALWQKCNLVQTLLEGYSQVKLRWSHLCAFDGGNIRVAMAGMMELHNGYWRYIMSTIKTGVVLLPIMLLNANCHTGTARIQYWFVDSLIKVFPGDQPGAASVGSRVAELWGARNQNISVQLDPAGGNA